MNAISNTIEARTRISAVVSCRRTSNLDSLVSRSSRLTPSTTRTTTTAKPASRINFESGELASREKKSESRMTAPKSATLAAAITSWPNGVDASPASFNTGTTNPNEVASRMMPINSGLRTRPAAKAT